MKNLIKVEVKNDRQFVSARELHKGLGLKGRFSRWFKTNSELFAENKDFYECTLGTVVKSGNGTVRRYDDYAITIDMAKQLAMMARTERSKQYREYFLDLERKWNSPQEVVKRGYAILQNENTQLKLENKNLGIQLEEANKRASYLDVIKLHLIMAVEHQLLISFLINTVFNIKSMVNGFYIKFIWVKITQLLM